MTRRQSLGPLDPIYNERIKYGGVDVGNSPGSALLTVTINQAAGQSDPTSTSPILFTAVFSEPVTGFTDADALITGTAGATAAVVTEITPFDGTTYEVSVSMVEPTLSLFDTLVSKGPYLLLRMNDAANPIEDYSGNNYDGTQTGLTLQNFAGPDGASYPDWDGNTGASRRVAVSDQNDFSLSSGKTIFIVTRPDTVATTRCLISKTNSGGRQEWDVRINDTNNGDVIFQWYTSAGVNIRTVQSPGSVVAAGGNWYCVAVTADGTPSTTQTGSINVNGVSQSITYLTGSGTYTDNSASVYVGSRQDTNLNNFDGKQAYACIFPALSAGDIADIMDAAQAEGWF